MNPLSWQWVFEIWRIQDMSNSQLMCCLLELWTSFKYGKWTSLNFCSTKKMWGIELSFYSWKKLLIWTKAPPWGDFSKLNTHSKIEVLVTSAVVQTSFRHGKWTFLKLCLSYLSIVQKNSWFEQKLCLGWFLKVKHSCNICDISSGLDLV